MTTSTRTPTTKLAADLEPGDFYLDPITGEVVTFSGWDCDIDGEYALVFAGRVQLDGRRPWERLDATYTTSHIDPSTLVNLEA